MRRSGGRGFQTGKAPASVLDVGPDLALGQIVNRDDGTDTADRFAEAIGLPILTRVPLNHRVRLLADSCKLALEVAEFDDLFGDLAGRIARREIPPCTDYRPLAYDEFLAVFGATEPPGMPEAATEQELFSDSHHAEATVDLSLTVLRQVHVADPVQRRVQEMLESIGIHVTGLDREADEGITATSGATEIRIGEPTDLDHKMAFLAALARTGQTFAEIDVRYADAPSYR